VRGRRYQVRIRLRDQTRSATFGTLRAARRWARTTEGALLAQRYEALPAATPLTLDDVFQRYTSEELPRKAQETARKYAQHLAWWQAQLGSLRLRSLQPAHVVACREALAVTHAPATVNRYLATLGHALTMAQEWGWLEVSSIVRIRRLREPPGRVRYLSDAERRRLLEACAASHQSLLFPLVVVALSTGARKMELLRLTWSDVDLRHNRLLLHETKNREHRSVPLTGKALEVLRDLGKVRRIDTPLCFPRADGREPVDLRYAWTVALQKAGIPDFRFHDLRHSCASYLAMNGASLLEIAEILGHKTLAMVKRYAHLTEAHTTAVVGRMTKAIFGSH
jgi:integrase